MSRLPRLCRDNGEDFNSPASTSQRSQRGSSDADHAPPRRPYADGPSSARDGPGRPGSREREAPPADDHDADYYDRPRYEFKGRAKRKGEHDRGLPVSPEFLPSLVSERPLSCVLCVSYRSSASSRPAPSGRGRPPPPEGPPSTRRRGDYPEDEHYNSSGGLREGRDGGREGARDGGREGGSSYRSRGGDRGDRGDRDYDRDGYAREYDDRDGYRGERGYGRDREAEDRRGDRGERDGHYDDYDYEARRPPPSGRGYRGERGEERGRGDRGYDDRDYDRDRDYEVHTERHRKGRGKLMGRGKRSRRVHTKHGGDVDLNMDVTCDV